MRIVPQWSPPDLEGIKEIAGNFLSGAWELIQRLWKWV